MKLGLVVGNIRDHTWGPTRCGVNPALQLHPLRCARDSVKPAVSVNCSGTHVSKGHSYKSPPKIQSNQVKAFCIWDSKHGCFSIRHGEKHPWIYRQGFVFLFSFFFSSIQSRNPSFFLVLVLVPVLFSRLVTLSLKNSCGVQDAKGKDVDLSIYKGKVLLVVNVASKWFFTFL